jgi:hypothetical protein
MIKHSSDGAAAVDTEYFWRPISTCPAGVKVQLINRDAGSAIYGVYCKVHNAKEFWTHWAPLPKFKD